MANPAISITANVGKDLIDDLDRYLSTTTPGAAGYFASRSEFVRDALRRRLDEVAPPLPSPTVRKRTRTHVA